MFPVPRPANCFVLNPNMASVVINAISVDPKAFSSDVVNPLICEEVNALT